MQIVIDIPEEVKAEIDKNINACDLDVYDCVMIAVKNGTPLPKGHGRLIDADSFLARYEVCGYIEDMEVGYFNAATPTIVEADKENSE